MNQHKNNKFSKIYFSLYFLSFFYINFFELKSNELNINTSQQILEKKINRVKDNPHKNTLYTNNWEKFNDKSFNKNSIKWELFKEKSIDKLEVINKKLDTFGSILQKLKQEQLSFIFTDLGLIVPTAYILNEGDLRLYLDQLFPLESGYLEQGRGNQNYSIKFDYGSSDTTMVSGFFSLADDPLYKKINSVDVQPENIWISTGSAFKWQFVQRNNFNAALDSAIELWYVQSGGCSGILCNKEYKKSSNIFDRSLKKAENFNIIGSTSLPLTWEINRKTSISLTPKISFLPSTQNVGNISGEFYGVNYGLGLGLSYSFNPKLSLFASNYFPFGGGNNTFDENINYKKSYIYNYGFNYSLDPKISFQTYITNSFGSTPSTSILTIPSSNESILGTRIVYTPSAYEYSLDVNESSKTFSSGLSVSSTDLVRTNENYFDISYDNYGSYWTTYRLGLSSSFDFEFISGSASNNFEQSNQYVDNYLLENEQTLRFGGRAILFSEEKGSPFTSGIRLTLGRSLGETYQGYLFLENINSKNISERLTINLNPKLAMTGKGDLFSLGTSINFKITNNIFIIPETNISIKESDSNWTISLRYTPKKNTFFDIYSTTSFNFVDLGELIKSKDPQIGLKFGIKI